MEYNKINSTNDGLSVFLGNDYDESPDVSYLGEMMNKRKADGFDFVFNRDTGELLYKGEKVGETSGVFVGRHDYGFIADFQEGWSLDDNSAGAATQFARNRLKKVFKKFHIPADSRKHSYGFWNAVVCMFEDAKRLEQFNEGDVSMLVYMAEVRDDSGKVLSRDCIGGIESDCSVDIMKEFFDVEDLLERARLERGDFHETLVAAGQLELF